MYCRMLFNYVYRNPLILCRWKVPTQHRGSGMLTCSPSIHDRRPVSAGAVRASFTGMSSSIGNIMFEKSPCQKEPFRSVVKPEQNHFLLSSDKFHAWVTSDDGNNVKSPGQPRRSPSPSTSTSPTPGRAISERDFYGRTPPEGVQSSPAMALVSPSGKIKLGKIREEPRKVLSSTNRRMTSTEVYLQEFRP